MAFQLRDDYLGIFGDFAVFGKAIGGDLREKKATLLLSKTFAQAAPTDKATLLSMLGKAEYTPDELRTIQKIMHKTGQAVLQEAHALADESKQILLTFPDSPARSRLLALVDYLIDRQI
jgi:geranylgeranyl diphosphate synthase type I